MFRIEINCLLQHSILDVCYLISGFLFLERRKSALLVIDIGKCKELHFSIKKQRNGVDREMNDFTGSIWNRISACEEQIEIKEIQQILHKEENDFSILVFAFDHKGFLSIWALNETFVFRQVDDAIETIFC